MTSKLPFCAHNLATKGADDDLPDIVDLVMEMGRAPDEPPVEAEARRHASQSFERSTGPSDTPEGVPDAHRSSLRKANRWLPVGDAGHSSPPALAASA
ncbi:hypothetical protein ACLKMW_21135, partial [Pseudaminobacter sp. NGMCC 1.201702]